MFSHRILSAFILVLLCAAGAVAQDGPICSVTPDSLNFNTCWIGDTCEMSFTITNTGGGILEGTVQESAPEFILRDYPDGHAFALAADEQLTVWIASERLFPHATHYEGTIVIDAAAGAEVPCYAIFQDAPQDVPVDCYADPRFLDFGALVVGEISDTQEYKIGNAGSRAMHVTIPAQLDDFHFEWPGEYLQTAWVYRQADFRPQTAGAHACTLIAASACTGISDVVILNGTGLHPFPSVEMDSNSMEFGMVLVGETGNRTIRISNTGNSGISGTMSITGEGYHIPEEQRTWFVSRGSFILVTAYFSPGETGESNGSLDLGNEYCDLVSLRATGTETSSKADIIGIYFEQSGQVNTFQTTEPFEEVTAYLMIVNPSVTAAGIQGWECCVDMTGPGMGLSFELAGQAINFETSPCFAVGMTGYPLLDDNPVTVATIRFWLPSPDDVARFYIHPTSQPSIPGSPCYLVGLNPGMLIPLSWELEDETLPVAVVNENPYAGVDSPPAAVHRLSNYPNPFNPGTTISFVMGAEAPVRLLIYDVGGRIVRTLLDGQIMETGLRKIVWNGCNESGHTVAAGIYFYQIETNSYRQTKRMTLLK